VKPALFLTLALALLPGCSLRSSLPILGTVPAFELIAENGQPFHSAQLEGNVWVADFFFTTCNGPCPRMSVQMREVQQATLDLNDIRLLSFTIDPANDTPEVLTAYARRYKALPARWRFLTGPPDALRILSSNTFHLAEVGGSLEHSSRFALIDRKMRIRAYYDTSTTNAIPQLLEDIRKLRNEIL
jgi:protein SCO1/2